MRPVRIALVAGALLAAASAAWAADARIEPCKNHYILDDPCPSEDPLPTFVRIEKLYSTADGNVQDIELRIVRSGNTPLVLTGRSITAKDRRGNTRSLPLQYNPYNVIGDPYANRDSILLGSYGDDWGPYNDMHIPRGFLPIDGGTVSIDGMDEIAFGPLPTDGRHALARDGTTTRADFEFWGQTDVADVQMTEFYHAALDHYFVTGRADEVELLKSGAIPGWQPTGKTFYVFSRALDPTMVPACRYLLTRPGGYSHFFSIDERECEALAGGEGNVRESASAFYAVAPVEGACGNAIWRYSNGQDYPFSLVPIYRLWNGRPETNHRFVTSLADRDAMIARGWIPEGSGPLGVAMCGTTGWDAYCVGNSALLSCATRD